MDALWVIFITPESRLACVRHYLANDIPTERQMADLMTTYYSAAVGTLSLYNMFRKCRRAVGGRLSNDSYEMDVTM